MCQLRLLDKGSALKGLVAFNSLAVRAFGLVKGNAIRCYQLSPEVYIVNFSILAVFGLLMAGLDKINILLHILFLILMLLVVVSYIEK